MKNPIFNAVGSVDADDETLNNLIKTDQIIFKYYDKDGAEINKFNPNGPLLNIAGICNKDRNIFGMMQHAERAADTNFSLSICIIKSALIHIFLITL